MESHGFSVHGKAQSWHPPVEVHPVEGHWTTEVLVLGQHQALAGERCAATPHARSHHAVATARGGTPGG